MTNTVKYIIRAVKYFFYFTFLMISLHCTWHHSYYELAHDFP